MDELIFFYLSFTFWKEYKYLTEIKKKKTVIIVKIFLYCLLRVATDFIEEKSGRFSS